MRTPRPAAIAATLSLAALFAVSDLPSGPGEADAHKRAPVDSLSALRNCESGGNYRTNTGNGYYGGYQFSADTWRALGYGGLPHTAPPAIQDEAALRLASTRGWSQWPACSRSLGLRGVPAPPPPALAPVEAEPPVMARVQMASATPVLEPDLPPAAAGAEIGRALMRRATSAPAI